MSVGLEVADSGNAACLLADIFMMLSAVARTILCCHACCMKTHAWNQFASFHSLANAEDLVCLSRIRWRWADPRLRSLFAVAAQQWRVFFVEIMPPTWLDQFDLYTPHKQVVRVSATRNGVWIVRPALLNFNHNHNGMNRTLAGTLRNFFHEAGIHEPVIWHLDADAPEVSQDLPSWGTLYLRPEPQASAFLNARERRTDATLRERADCLIDARVLAKPASGGWNDVCGQIMRAACRRHHARMFQPFSI